MTSRSCLISALLLVIALWARSAAADAFAEAYERGVAQYSQQRFPEALRTFEEAYALRPLPRLLVNIGKTHRKLGHAHDALVCFQRFLQTDPDAPAALRTTVQGYVAELDRELHPPPPPKVVTAPPPPPPPPPPPLWRRPWLWITVGGVVALGVTAGALGAVYGSEPPSLAPPGVPLLTIRDGVLRPALVMP